MAANEPEAYGERWADVYDEWIARFAQVSDAEVVAERLAELAGDGRALELAIGTGRVALPLARRGVEVHGVDASQRMVEKLRAKPGGEGIPVTIGDFADVSVEGSYRLIYVIYNTLFALLTQDDQVRCFENVSAHLDEDGVFVVEAFVPDLGMFDRGQRVDASGVDDDRVAITLAKLDAAAQRTSASILIIEGGAVRTYPVQIRFAWPSELDLMARLAGLRLRDRWSGWDGAPFDSSSTAHVSVYARG
jgi:SAM-dependent methyltransferase